MIVVVIRGERIIREHERKDEKRKEKQRRVVRHMEKRLNPQQQVVPEITADNQFGMIHDCAREI